MLLFEVLLQNIQIKGQYLNADIIQPSDKYLVCSVDRNPLILVKALNLLFARLYILATCFVKVSSSRMVIPKSFTSLLNFICLFSIANVILPLSIFDPRNIIWNLSGFPTMLLPLDQFKTIYVSLDSLWATSL